MKRSRHTLDDLYLFAGLASLIIGLLLILLSVTDVDTLRCVSWIAGQPKF